jgi:hypothetical protein
MSVTTDDDEDTGRPRFIRMRAEDTFDGQECAFTRAVYDLQVHATAHFARCGHPGMYPATTSSTWTAWARPRACGSASVCAEATSLEREIVDED